MKIELDLDIIKANADLREEENMDFRAYLKGEDTDIIDQYVHEIYQDVIEEVDCTKCANCCKKLDTCFQTDEIDALTKALNIDKEEFIEEHTRPDESGDFDSFVLKSRPCKFLDNNKCTVYDLRPEKCQSYPHLHKDRFISRLMGVVLNYEMCPIVYNVYELLKIKLDYTLDE